MMSVAWISDINYCKFFAFVCLSSGKIRLQLLMNYLSEYHTYLYTGICLPLLKPETTKKQYETAVVLE